MPNLISGGKISAVVFENYAEITASFLVAPPFDGEVLLPFIPNGTLYNLEIIKNKTVIYETKAVNIREFNASPVNNSVMIYRRMDGRIILKLTEVLGDEAIEVKIGCITRMKESDGCFRMIFPSGWGDEVFMQIAVETPVERFKITSPSHNINTFVSENMLKAEFYANVNGEKLIVDILSEKKSNPLMVSRRLFGDNMAFCSFIPKASGRCKVEPIGGILPKILENEMDLVEGEKAFCFITHRVVPPKGIRISSLDKSGVEEIYFDNVISRLMFMPVEMLYADRIIIGLEEKLKNAPPDERCLIRENINEICMSSKTVREDVALVCVMGEEFAGAVSVAEEKERDYGRFLREDMKLDCREVIEMILSSQTSDGVIAEISLADDNSLVFSTAVCLIALYLYTENTYEKFAKRSVSYLKDKKGSWAETAIRLWKNESVDLKELQEKSEMKIMYKRLDELAVSLIKNFRRKEK